jgi:hypothetical protein
MMWFAYVQEKQGNWDAGLPDFNNLWCLETNDLATAKQFLGDKIAQYPNADIETIKMFQIDNWVDVSLSELGRHQEAADDDYEDNDVFIVAQVGKEFTHSDGTSDRRISASSEVRLTHTFGSVDLKSADVRQELAYLLGVALDRIHAGRNSMSL